MKRHYKPQEVPFVEARHMGSKQRPSAITLVLSGSTSDKGAALATATALHRPNAPTQSFHYFVDEDSVYQGMPVDRAPYNSPYRSIAILVCAEPQAQESDWDHGQLYSVERRTAELVAQLTLKHRIRTRHLEGDDLIKWSRRRWKRNGGILVRGVGAWPIETFLLDVRANQTIQTA